MLTAAEVEALPEEIREHYRQHNHVRSMDDLVWFPPAKREVFEQLAARGAAKTVERIRRQEGDEAAEAVARGVAAAADERAQRVARLNRRAS